MERDSDAYRLFLHLAQKCLETGPAVVLGSGASAMYGIGGMGALADHLAQSVVPTQGEADAWKQFRASLQATGDLEQTLQDTELPATLVKKIVYATRDKVLSDDIDVLRRALRMELSLFLSRLYRHLFSSTINNIDVVTTNYDRLAEYAAETAGYGHFTGYSQGYVRSFQPQAVESSNLSSRRIVRIWKVHGSVDWCRTDADTLRGFPDVVELDEGMTPLLVTPGATKYQETHKEPFRSIMTRADQALESAAGFLIVGYGFNDEHIQPKLIERTNHPDIPLVILARTLTNNAKQFIRSRPGQSFLAMERDQDGTKIYSAESPEGIVLGGCSLWDPEEFLKEVLG